MNNFIFFIITI